MSNKIALFLLLFFASSNCFPAIRFDAADGYVNLGSNFNFTSEPFTFSTWLYIRNFVSATPGQGGMIVYKGSYQTSGYYVQMGLTGAIALLTNQAGAVQFSVTGDVLALNRWQHFCVTRSGSSVRLYVDGIDRTSTAGTHTNPSSSALNFQIGRYETGNIGFDGSMDDFRVYNRVLSQSEISSLALSRNRILITDGLLCWLKMGEGAVGQNAEGTNRILDSSGRSVAGTGLNGLVYDASSLGKN